MEILKIATAGSVDVGKSTLIGRLLYDTASVTKDKLDAIELSSKRKGLDFVDLSLLTDGLIAEREQNITIDVAHIYFSTPGRKYIIADSPGHFEYIRNMITGASNAEAFIVSVDAMIGVTEQTKRHLFIADLLNIETVFLCINKMDLTGFNESVFNLLKNDIGNLSEQIGFKGELFFIPVAAKHGDNVVFPSANMKWYKGKPLLEYLETLPVHKKDILLPLRLVVQGSIDPTPEYPAYRRYAGKLLSGTVTTGQIIINLPSLQHTAVRSIYHSTKKVETALAGQSITLELDKDINLERGNIIVATDTPFSQASGITATICWLHEEPMLLNSNYLLQQGVTMVSATVVKISGKLDVQTMQALADTGEISLNDIATVTIHTSGPIFADSYHANPRNGTFIMIDENSNNTVAVGFVESCQP